MLPPPLPVLKAILEHALVEDLGRGDLTTDALFDSSQRSHASLVSREPSCLAGRCLIAPGFELLGVAHEALGPACDGDTLEAGALIAELRAPTAALLHLERVLLNLMQRLTGIATTTQRYVSALPAGSRTRIADTRKTTPGLRALERYAVRCGGGSPHRDNLGSAPMIKDNHLAASGLSIAEAISRVRNYAPHTARITCEVDTLEAFEEALAARADIVLLDNFGLEQVRAAVDINQGRACLEASGGITEARITELAEAGVDVISVGALTHSAPAIDLALDWDET